MTKIFKLFHHHIAGTGVDGEERAAAANFAGYRFVAFLYFALHGCGDGVIDGCVSGTGGEIDVERGIGRNMQTDVTGSGMNAPGRFWGTSDCDVAATGAGP